MVYMVQHEETLNLEKGGTCNKHDPKKFGFKINHSNVVSKFDQIWNLIRDFSKKNLVTCLRNANPTTCFDKEKFNNWFQ
jgi:hypothetical protein